MSWISISIAQPTAQPMSLWWPELVWHRNRRRVGVRVSKSLPFRTKFPATTTKSFQMYRTIGSVLLLIKASIHRRRPMAGGGLRLPSSTTESYPCDNLALRTISKRRSSINRLISCIDVPQWLIKALLCKTILHLTKQSYSRRTRLRHNLYQWKCNWSRNLPLQTADEAQVTIARKHLWPSKLKASRIAREVVCKDSSQMGLSHTMPALLPFQSQQTLSQPKQWPR